MNSSHIASALRGQHEILPGCMQTKEAQSTVVESMDGHVSLWGRTQETEIDRHVDSRYQSTLQQPDYPADYPADCSDYSDHSSMTNTFASMRDTEGDTEGEESPGSDYESTSGESTTSISDEDLCTRELHGRPYQTLKGTTHWSPTDELHCEAMDLINRADELLLGGKLHAAELDSGKLHRVLDIGTGTGAWAISFAERHPSTIVTGVDISFYPSYCSDGRSRHVPVNFESELYDYTHTQDWAWREDLYDFVRVRRMAGSIPDWGHFHSQVYKCLAPGGLVESYESSFQLECKSGRPLPQVLQEWNDLFAKQGKVSGYSFTVVDDGTQRKCMEEAGFRIIEERDLELPIGDWHPDPVLREAGSRAREAYTRDTGGFLYHVADMDLWNVENTAVLAARVRKQLNSQQGLWMRVKIVVGQKP